jgi:hypothetical protein
MVVDPGEMVAVKGMFASPGKTVAQQRLVIRMSHEAAASKRLR